MATYNEAFITQKLSSFFHSSTTNKLSQSHQVDFLPFYNTLFYPFLELNKTQIPQKSPKQQQILTHKQPNSFYYLNIIKFLGPYFTNKQKVFRIFCAKEQKIKVVNGGEYFMDVIFDGFEQQWRQKNREQQSDRQINPYHIERPLRSILQYYMGHNDQQSIELMADQGQNQDLESRHSSSTYKKEPKNQCLQILKLTLNRLLSLPELWLNSKMSAKSQSLEFSSQNINFPHLYIKYKFILSTLTVKYISQELFDNNQAGKELELKDILVYVLNKISIQTNFLSQIIQNHKIQQHQPNHRFSNVWETILFEGETSCDNSNHSEQVERRKNFHQFFINNFDSLVKKQKLLELLFYIWVNRINSVRYSSQQKRISTLETPQSREVKQLLVDLLSKNLQLKKQLYSIVESSSQLSQMHLKPSLYLHFYYLLSQIDQQHHQKALKDSQQKYKDYVFRQLSFWWSINKDFLITPNACYFRYNLLAYLVENSSSQYLQTYQSGSILAWLSQGIQARIVDSRYYTSAILIWSKLAQTLGIEIDKSVFKKANYFQNIVLNNQHINKKDNKIQHQDTSRIPEFQHNFHQIQTVSNQLKIQIQNPLSPEPKTEDQLKEESEFNQTDDQIFSQKINQQQLEQFKENNQYMFEIKLKPPQTFYDCILALQNPVRRQIGFKQLQKLLNTQQQDVIFVWKSLIKVLMHPLEQQSKQCLKKLFIIRPKEWIQDVGELYFKKDLGMNEKITFIEMIQDGINELAENPHKLTPIQDDSNQEFYFKRVSSKYYTQKPIISETPKDPQRTRRWGHTRIAHEKKMNSSLTHCSTNPLLIVNNNTPYINRLYEVVSQLFFKIVIKLADGIDKSVSKLPLYTQKVLNLLSTVSQNLKNYIQKYLILEDVVAVCLKVLVAVERLLNNDKKEVSIFNFQPKQDKKSLSQLIISCIQTLNKVALSIDKFVPELIMLDLKQCVLKLKRIDMYSIGPLIQMLEAKIYKNTTGSMNLFLNQ